ncbi:MAG: cobalt-precorrin 5A hydrolase [Methanospirillum sp.]|nr:cobalt-precorrin 5A hydrolase [Methanospirillum sp.]
MFPELFSSADRIVAIMAIGIVIRSITPLIRDKWTDPPVVVVSPDIRYAIPVLGGHHGGNDLAYLLAARYNLEPVITTATEATGKAAVEVIAAQEHLRVVNTWSTRESNTAVLNGNAGIYRTCGPGMVIAGPGVSFLVAEGLYTVGIGCRLGTRSEKIIDALNSAFQEAGINPDDVSVYASVSLKTHEQGLIEAIRQMGKSIIFINPEDLDDTHPYSRSAAQRFGLPGVAEPAALAASLHHRLIMEKRVYGDVTIAIAQ